MFTTRQRTSAPSTAVAAPTAADALLPVGAAAREPDGIESGDADAWDQVTN